MIRITYSMLIICMGAGHMINAADKDITLQKASGDSDSKKGQKFDTTDLERQAGNLVFTSKYIRSDNLRREQLKEAYAIQKRIDKSTFTVDRRLEPSQPSASTASSVTTATVSTSPTATSTAPSVTSSLPKTKKNEPFVRFMSKGSQTLDSIHSFLLKNPKCLNSNSINAPDKDGKTYLHYLAQENPFESENRKKLLSSIKGLFRFNPDLNIQDNDGNTPLLCCNNVFVAKMLCEQGANPWLINNQRDDAHERIAPMSAFYIQSDDGHEIDGQFELKTYLKQAQQEYTQKLASAASSVTHMKPEATKADGSPKRKDSDEKKTGKS